MMLYTIQKVGNVNSDISSSTPVSTPRTPTLTPTRMEPLQLNHYSEAAERLQQIVWLEVASVEHVEGQGRVCEVHIFVQEPQSRLRSPTASSNVEMKPKVLCKPENREPDYSIQRPFADFKRLRSDLEDVVEACHGNYCRLCYGYQTLLTFSSTRPAMALGKCLPRRLQLKCLNKFLVDILLHYQNNASTNNRQRRCKGTKDVALLIYKCLFGDVEFDGRPSSMSERSSSTSNW